MDFTEYINGHTLEFYEDEHVYLVALRSPAME